MAKNLSDHLLHTLESLVAYDLEKFKFKLQNANLDKDLDPIPQGRLQNAAGPVKLATLLVNSYGEKYAVKLTLQVLRAINQHLLAEELSKATSPECFPQEYVTETLEASVFSRETGSKRLETTVPLKRIIENPDADLQSPDEVSTAGLQVPISSSQMYVEQECQKKFQRNWEDQRTFKGSHLTEVQQRPRSQTVNIRPKGTQLTFRPVSSGDKEPSSPESAVTLENKIDGILETAINLKKVEARNSNAAQLLESHQYENSEVAGTLEQKTNGNPKLFFYLGERGIPKQGFGVSLGEQNHPNEKSVNNGPGNPEVSVSLGKNVTLSNCQVPGSQEEEIPGHMYTSMSSGKKEPQNPGNQYLKEDCEDELMLSKTPIKAFSMLKISGAPVRAVSLRRVQESCSICQDMVREPSRNSCMHHIRYHHNAGYNVCLKCQAMFPKNFQHSKSLGNIPTDFQEPMLNPRFLPHCEHHPKQLQLMFCKEHGKTICFNCSMSPEHRGHRILPIEEAAQSYKEQIQSRLEQLKKVRETAEEKKSQGNETMAAFLSKTETQKEQIMSRLEQVHQFLVEQEQLFLVWLEELSGTIFRSKEEYVMKASKEISLLEELMGKLEEKQKQPAWELLQDIKVTLMRAEWVSLPKEWTVSPELKEKIHTLFWKSECVQKSMRRFIESLQSEMETFKILQLRDVQLHAANVTLDPETAHPKLIISDDQKSVSLGKKCQKLPNGPQRFDDSVIVLGSPSFVSGKRYWQVYVGDKTMWTLGVCKNSVNRKGSTAFSPGNGYWLVMMTKKNEYSASTIPPTPLSLGEPPRCVGIFLDYEAGDISFYNVTAKSHIYTFPFSSSSSDALRPVFSPGMHDKGKNTDPLTICPVSR
ncbi:pyrin [Dromiciops gliroides]|uniref:pyrin n=1 Tax=Dromiciops gliroides TaxID=33562 RepID=UPI001CC5FF9E|nr:pyrin [Dromiciops gliroides]